MAHNSKMARSRATLSALLLGTAAMTALSACSTTHLSGYPVATASARNPIAGIGYALPATIFDVTVTRKLASCEGASIATKTKAASPGIAKFTTDATVVAQQVAGDQFRLDYQALGSALKTTTLKLETYPNGTLKSINAEVTDHGPEVATSVLKSVAAVARLALGLPGGGAASPDGKAASPLVYCTAAANTALKAIADSRHDVEQHTAALDVATATIERFNEQRAVGTLDKIDFAKFNAALDLSASEEAALKTAMASLDAALADVTIAESFTWPGNQGETEAVVKPGKLVVAKLAKFVNGNFYPDDNLSVVVALRPVGALWSGVAGGHVAPPPLPASGGIYYRMPGNGQMLVCAPEVPFADADKAATGKSREISTNHPDMPDQERTDKIDAARKAKLLEVENAAIKGCSSANHSTLLVDQLLAIPQFGQLYVMPLQNGWGQDNVLTGSWREDGSPESLSYQEKKASAEATASVIEAAVGQAVSLDKDLRARTAADKASALADKAAADKAELDALTHQTDVLKKRQELAEAKASLARNAEGETGAAEKASIDADTSLINANKARLQAQIDYRDLQAKAVQP